MAEKSLEAHFVECLKEGNTKKALYIINLLGDKVNTLYDYRSPLFWAKKYGNEKVIKALSDMEAVEEVDKEGMSEELFKILDADDIDEEAEKRAITLIKDGANLEKKYIFGETALVKASNNGYTEIVKVLIDTGAKVDEKNKWNNTALIMASANGYLDVVKALIENGVKVDEKNDNDFTALITASQKGHVEVVKTLIEKGAKVDEKDNRGYTALIWASENGHVKIAKALLDAGADVNIKNEFGETAMSLTKYEEIRRVIIEAVKKRKEKAKENEPGFMEKMKGLFGKDKE